MVGARQSERSYRPRLADPYVAELLREFPAVMMTGPRAAGKTTTASRYARQVDRLDTPGVEATYRADPDAALRRATRPLLIDEWQQVPEVLAAVKRWVDVDPTPGQFLLTGSVRADLSHETWAGTGRIVRMPILGLTEREIAGQISPGRESFLVTLSRGAIDDFTVPDEHLVIDDYLRLAVRGGFPEVAYRKRSERAVAVWLASYVDDLITRDALELGNEKDPAKLRRYLEVIALNSAGMPTDATIYRAAGVTAKTAASYEQLLENLYVLSHIPAWSTNRLNRLVKAPKRYLVDTGLAAAAGHLTTYDVVHDPDLAGRFLDGLVMTQLRPEMALTFPAPRAYHLRTEGGRHEVDIVVEMGVGRVVALEVRATSAPAVDDARHLRWLRDQLGASFLAGAVLHTGPGLFELGDRIYAIPVSALWS